MKKLFCFQALEVFRKQQTPISMRYLESILCFQDSFYKMRQRHNFSENAKKTIFFIFYTYIFHFISLILLYFILFFYTLFFLYSNLVDFNMIFEPERN